MMDFEQSLVDIVQKYRSTFDAAGRKALMYQYNNIFTKNVYDLGVFVGRYGLGIGQARQERSGWHAGVHVHLGGRRRPAGYPLDS